MVTGAVEVDGAVEEDLVIEVDSVIEVEEDSEEEEVRLVMTMTISVLSGNKHSHPIVKAELMIWRLNLIICCKAITLMSTHLK